MTSPVTFLKETQAELRQVKWPTRDEVVRLTSVVVAVSLIVGLYIGGLDLLFTKLIELILQ